MKERMERELESTLALMEQRLPRPRRRKAPRRALILALAVVLALGLTVGAGALIHWTGFAFTENLSKQELDAMMEQAAAVHMEAEDADGNVHYYDSNGNETGVLSAEEAYQQRMAKIEADWQKVRESTTLLDVDTMELIPNGITEVPVGSDGKFADFALGNGYMILLYPQDGRTYALKRGQTVTMGLTVEESCHLSFDLIRDGVMLEENMFDRSAAENAEETVGQDGRSPRYTYRFTIPEDGDYSFGVEYWSLGACTFTDGVLIVE